MLYQQVTLGGVRERRIQTIGNFTAGFVNRAASSESMC